MKTVIGVFDDTGNAQFAIQCLKVLNYKAKDISIIMKAPVADGQFVKNNDGIGIGRTTVTGVTTGAVVGGLAGLLIAIGTLAIPGLGTILITGPLATLLGLTGAAAATASGAVTGAVAGGVLAAIMSLGLPKKEAKRYEKKVQEGAILLAIPVMDDQEIDVEEILREHDATDIKSVDVPLYYTRPNDNVGIGSAPYAAVGIKGGKRSEHSKHITEYHIHQKEKVKSLVTSEPEIEIR